MTKVLLALAGGIAALSGCATTTTVANDDQRIDTAYIAAVEQAAKRFGTQVIWVNYPVKREAASR